MTRAAKGVGPQQVVRWDAGVKDVVLSARKRERIVQQQVMVGVVEREQTKLKSRKGSLLPEAEASSYGSNDRRPIARAARASSGEAHARK